MGGVLWLYAAGWCFSPKIPILSMETSSRTPDVHRDIQRGKSRIVRSGKWIQWGGGGGVSDQDS